MYNSSPFSPIHRMCSMLRTMVPFIAFSLHKLFVYHGVAWWWWCGGMVNKWQTFTPKKKTECDNQKTLSTKKTSFLPHEHSQISISISAKMCSPFLASVSWGVPIWFYDSRARYRRLCSPSSREKRSTEGREGGKIKVFIMPFYEEWKLGLLKLFISPTIRANCHSHCYRRQFGMWREMQILPLIVRSTPSEFVLFCAHRRMLTTRQLIFQNSSTFSVNSATSSRKHSFQLWVLPPSLSSALSRELMAFA